MVLNMPKVSLPPSILLYAGVILGQNCVRLSDAALDDYFFKNLLYQKQCKNAKNIGVPQI